MYQFFNRNSSKAQNLSKQLCSFCQQEWTYIYIHYIKRKYHCMQQFNMKYFKTLSIQNNDDILKWRKNDIWKIYTTLLKYHKIIYKKKNVGKTLKSSVI